MNIDALTESNIQLVCHPWIFDQQDNHRKSKRPSPGRIRRTIRGQSQKISRGWFFLHLRWRLWARLRKSNLVTSSWERKMDWMIPICRRILLSFWVEIYLVDWEANNGVRCLARESRSNELDFHIKDMLNFGILVYSEIRELNSVTFKKARSRHWQASSDVIRTLDD